MPFALLLIGLILVITGFQNTYGQFGKQLKGDLTGQNNFIYWIVAIVVIGAIGYVKPFEKFSRGFLALIIVSMIVSNSKNGLFNRLQQALGTTNNSDTSVTPTVITPSVGANSVLNSTGGIINSSNITNL